MPDWLMNLLYKVEGSPKMAQPQMAYPMQPMAQPNLPDVTPMHTMTPVNQTVQDPRQLAMQPYPGAPGVTYDPSQGYNPNQTAPANATPMPLPHVTPDPKAQLPTGNNWLNVVNQALKIADQYGIPPAVLIGQMALESGHGQSAMAQKKNNYFGYQAYDANPNAAAKFTSPEQSIVAYAKTLTGDTRYKKAMADKSDSQQMLQDIKAAGYASDPDYVAKVMGVPEYRKYLKK